MGAIARPEPGFDIGKCRCEAEKIRLLRQIPDNGPWLSENGTAVRFDLSGGNLSRVDLPDPLRPTRATRSPEETDSSTPERKKRRAAEGQRDVFELQEGRSHICRVGRCGCGFAAGQVFWLTGYRRKHPSSKTQHRLVPADMSVLPPKADINRLSLEVHKVPCVDGSGLARAFFTNAALVGAAICSAFVCGSHDAGHNVKRRPKGPPDWSLFHADSQANLSAGQTARAESTLS